ncbi:MAG: hypothetical protein P0Y65_01885 [Candidatus Devosia phytovorans]|uniref:Uncharacterized protein n=1 Tax=Candidatus Devosia phytovorans TaxID=3121372 RepID=A0AAJ5VVT8_9HYPH|nr:hypothetical protein [Devosia sp.]WEK05026.1 MAG: hypothetical protein P0Y65_01885 [Devosia sp.]
MSFVNLPLPSRSLAIKGRPFAAPAAFLFTLVILSALAIGLAWWQGPGLWRDIQISQAPLTIDDWEMLDGECSTRRGLTDCETHVTYTYEGQDYDKHITIAFLDFSSGDYLVDLVISEDDPDLATISLGLDMLWNRLAVFGVFMALFVGGPLVMVWSAFQANRANGAANVAGRIEVVPVQVTGVDEKRGQKNVAYVPVVNGKRKGNMIRSHFRDGDEPLMAVGDDGAWYGVAVKSEQLGMPVLLDRGLMRLDIADSERQHALAAFEIEQSERGVAPSEAQAQTKNPSPWKATLRGVMAAGGVLVLMVIGIFGYWVYYATSAGDAFDSIGIEINNLMPQPLNDWACSQLYERFGDERAPYGCVADDYTSWKVAPGKTKS